MYESLKAIVNSLYHNVNVYNIRQNMSRHYQYSKKNALKNTQYYNLMGSYSFVGKYAGVSSLLLIISLHLSRVWKTVKVSPML